MGGAPSEGPDLRPGRLIERTGGGFRSTVGAGRVPAAAVIGPEVLEVKQRLRGLLGCWAGDRGSRQPSSSTTFSRLPAVGGRSGRGLSALVWALSYGYQKDESGRRARGTRAARFTRRARRTGVEIALRGCDYLLEGELGSTRRGTKTPNRTGQVAPPECPVPVHQHAPRRSGGAARRYQARRRQPPSARPRPSPDPPVRASLSLALARSSQRLAPMAAGPADTASRCQDPLSSVVETRRSVDQLP